MNDYANFGFAPPLMAAQERAGSIAEAITTALAYQRLIDSIIPMYKAGPRLDLCCWSPNDYKFLKQCGIAAP